MAALLAAQHLTKAYPQSGGKDSLVVDDVSFTLERGNTLGLVGESGSGKSTIARMILGLTPPTGGSVIFDGQAIENASGSAMRQLRRRMQPVFQDPYAALNPRMRVRQILAEPFLIHKPENVRGKAARRSSATRMSSQAASGSASISRAPWRCALKS
jgi:ABC-type glutathione transport system ATPase component